MKKQHKNSQSANEQKIKELETKIEQLEKENQVQPQYQYETISKSKHQEVISEIQKQNNDALNTYKKKIKELETKIELLAKEQKQQNQNNLDLQNQEFEEQTIKKTLTNKNKKSNQNAQQRFQQFTREISQQYKVIYENLEDFTQKFKLGETLGSGSYGTVRELINLQKDNENEEEEELVVKQLNCSDFDQDIQENEVISLKKVQLLPEKYRKRILDIRNVYWDPIKEKINMIIPKAQLSFKEEINIRMENNDPYSQEELLFKLSCALEGLFTLETLGMAHRDIKTDNMLIMKDGSLVIADLGTAKKLDYQIATMTIGVGTQKFWPPEQIEAFLKLEKKDYYQYIQSAQANKNFKTNDLYGVGISFILAASLSKLPNFKISQPEYLEIYKKERETWLEFTLTRLKNEKKYSLELISLLENIVQEDVNKRYTLLQSAEALCEIKEW